MTTYFHVTGDGVTPIASDVLLSHGYPWTDHDVEVLLTGICDGSCGDTVVSPDNIQQQEETHS